MKRIHFYIVDTKLYFSQKVIKINQQKMAEIKMKERKSSYMHGEEEEKMAKIRSKKKINCNSHDGMKRRRFSSLHMALFRSFAASNCIARKQKKKTTKDKSRRNKSHYHFNQIFPLFQNILFMLQWSAKKTWFRKAKYLWKFKKKKDFWYSMQFQQVNMSILFR